MRRTPINKNGSNAVATKAFFPLYRTFSSRFLCKMTSFLKTILLLIGTQKDKNINDIFKFKNQ
jgi:hypothetical protein